MCANETVSIKTKWNSSEEKAAANLSRAFRTYLERIWTMLQQLWIIIGYFDESTISLQIALAIVERWFYYLAVIS